MTKLSYLTFFTFILFIFSCENKEQNNTKTSTPKVENKEQIIEKEELGITSEKKQKEVTIEGENIWIRKTPITGEVVMKLNTGDVCKVLEEGEEVQIKNMLDKWYKIEFNDTIGWVFGSQTNLKSGKTVEIEDFSEFIKKFSAKLTKQDFSTVIHKDIGLNIVHNPGVFSVLDNDASSRIPKSKINISSNNIFNKKPEGHFCEGYPKIKNALYFWKSKKEDLPVGVNRYDEENDSIIVDKIKFAEKYQNNQIYKVQLIKDEYHHSYYYFINIGTSWYLLAEDYCDCSA